MSAAIPRGYKRAHAKKGTKEMELHALMSCYEI